MLHIEPINRLIEEKWERFAKHMFVFNFIVYVIYLIIFTAVSYHREEGKDHSDNQVSIHYSPETWEFWSSCCSFSIIYLFPGKFAHWLFQLKCLIQTAALNVPLCMLTVNVSLFNANVSSLLFSFSHFKSFSFSLHSVIEKIEKATWFRPDTSSLSLEHYTYSLEEYVSVVCTLLV